MKRFHVADLFCGAGGLSTGLIQACEAIGVKANLVAINHWERAVETHAANHPSANHHCQNLADLDPRKAVPGGKLDLLAAAPACTHHSVARGGMPVSDQSRSSAWCILRWVTALQVKRILIENVPEFESWGPIGTNGRPLKSKRGETFSAFVKSLQSLGYRVEWRVLNAADYGAATSRRRLFVQAAKGKQMIRWPERTHLKNPEPGLFATLPKWRGAREVIDWNLKGTSIFERKRPLSANTLRRIEAGLKKFGGAAAEPFLVLLRGTDQGQVNGSSRSLSEPAPTISTSGAHLGLAEPFLMSLTHGGRLHDADNPLPTVTTAKRGEIAIVEPDTLNLVRVVDGNLHIIDPFVVRACNGGDHNCRVKSPDDPLGTIHAGGGSYGIVEPFILPHRQFKQMDVDSIDDPMRTVTATNGGCNAIVEPFVIPYYGTASPDSTHDPLSTVTTKDRFGLVEPVNLDIRFRMLQPHELAAAMGFPPGYKITGNRGEQVKQIGNAVEVNQARALALAMIGVG